MDEVQSWWEVPCIAHFCSLFRTSFDLPDFDIEELEEALLTDSIEEVGSGLLQDLIVRLLKGSFNVLQQDEITTSNYEMFLRRLFRTKCEVDVTRKNPFDSDVAFFSLPLRTKVEILNDLCDYRLDADDITELLKSIEAESLRVEPLGQDSGGSTYWYFYGTRLYREDYHTIHKSPPKKRGRKVEERTVSKWQVVCFTEEDWHLLTSKFKNCKHKDERNLYTTLREDFLPELSRLFAEKERVMRKRMMDKQLRRSRKESPPPPQPPNSGGGSDDELLRKQRLEQEEADRRLAEEIQRQERTTGRDLRERRGTHSLSSPQPVNSPKLPQHHHRNRKEDNSGGNSRMTNNSMSALLARKEGDDDDDDDEMEGDESGIDDERHKKVIKAKVKEKKGQITSSKTGSSKTKVKSSIVFSATEEDIQIGMHKVIEYIKGHRDAWPFIGPVDEDYAPNYYKVIKQPMDLQTIEDKLDNHEYVTLDQFRTDFQLVVLNCHKYNGDSSEYTEMVDNLEKAFHKAITRFILPDESDEEISVEYASTHERKKPRLISQSQPRVADEKPVRQTTPIPLMPPKVKLIEEIVVSSPSPRKKRKKKKTGKPEKGSTRSDMENSEDEHEMKKRPKESSHHKKQKGLEKEKLKERPIQKEIDPKDRPMKKRPRELTPPNSPVARVRSPSPPPKYQHHRHHHHHKHSKSHERKDKEKRSEQPIRRSPLPPWKLNPKPSNHSSNHHEKGDHKGLSLSTPTPNPNTNISHPGVGGHIKKISDPSKNSKIKKSSIGSTIMGFKSPNLMNMKRLQVGKATKFKIKSSPSTQEEKSKEVTTNSSSGSTNLSKGDETQEKKRCLLLNEHSSQRLSFGTVLPKHALPLRDFKANRSDDEDLGESEPLPQNPTQEEILERLEKTFGASLARTTKDQLAKVILAPETPEQTKPSVEEEDEKNTSRLELSKGFNREKSLPNLSAWFKAFGSPKLNSPTNGTPEKDPETPTTPKPAKFSLMGRCVGDNTPKSSPVKQCNHVTRPNQPTTVVTKEEPEEPPPPPAPPNKDEEPEPSHGSDNRERRMSTSSLSSQSEVGSPTVFPPAGSETPGAPRWVENRSEAWVSGSPSASSQVSSQSPAGPNSPFSPPINSPPTPQTPPRPAAPVRVGFYQDYSVHSSPEKTADLNSPVNVSSPATPPPSNYNARYHTPYGASSSSSPSHKQDESPVQSPQYTLLRPSNYDSARGSKEPPPPAQSSQQPPPPTYGLFPEAAHSASARYSLSTPAAAHGNAEPQAAHQYSRESPAYSHSSRVGVNGQHYGNPAYTHTPPPRPMHLYNPNERFYKSDGGLGLSILSTAVSTSTSTVTSSNNQSGGSGGKSRKEKEPKQQQQQVEQLATVNGFQWPHNLASLTQIVNSIPNAMTTYMNAPPHAHAHYAHEAAHGYTNLANNARGAESTKNENSSSSTPSPAPSGRRSTSKLLDSKSSSRSGGSKNRNSEVSNSPSAGIVPGSAFNFSSLSTPELALYSKEMNDYNNSQPSIAHAHHRPDLYSSPSPTFHPSFPAGSSGRGTSSYQLGAFHPSAYQGTTPQNYSTTPRGMVDPYQGLFQGSPHVMGLYPPPYPHPHSLPFPNRPGWI